MPHEESFVTIRGVRLRLMRGGHGPPLMFLHGASGHTGWLPFLEALSERFDVLAPEHPGFGVSDDPPWLDRPSDLAYFYLYLLSELGLSDAHLLGTSLGGWIAAELAIRNTSRLATLTLIGAVGITAGGEPIDDVFRMSPEENARRFYFDPARVEGRLAALSTADPKIVARNRSTVVRLAYRPRFHDPDLAKWLSRIDIPTLLIWGESDGLVPVRFGEAYRDGIPSSRLVVLPEAAHAPHDEQPEAFLKTLCGFIDAASPS